MTQEKKTKKKKKTTLQYEPIWTNMTRKKCFIDYVADVLDAALF